MAVILPFGQTDLGSQNPHQVLLKPLADLFPSVRSSSHLPIVRAHWLVLDAVASDRVPFAFASSKSVLAGVA